MDEKTIKALDDLLIDMELHNTREDSLRRLMNGGIVDENGNFTSHYPTLAAWQKERKCIPSDQT